MSNVTTSACARMLLAAGVLVSLVAMLVSLLSPATELTRFRNSLLADIGRPADFLWTPDAYPAGFRRETRAPPKPFAELASRLRPEHLPVLPATVKLVEHLRSQPKRRGPIKATTVEAYREIVSKGRGYCADYTQVLNGLAHSTNLAVREWGMSFDRYSGDGHAFSEIYDPDTEQWIFIDPMNAFYAVDRASTKPLSVMEFRDRLLSPSGFDSVSVVPIGNAFLFDSDREAFEYYQQGRDQFFLYFGNDVFSYDSHPAVSRLSIAGRAVEQLGAITLGIQPQIKLLPTNSNSDEMQGLLRFKHHVLILAGAVALVASYLFVQLYGVLRVAFRQRTVA